MSAKGTKNLKEKHQTILNDLLREEANRYCADCRAKGPRWASWNLGVFVCIRCAGIHRNLGVHISRVKSVNLDSWTPEQMESIEKWGNRRAAEYYECFLPQDFVRPHGDSAMEILIRNKYERKLYIKKDGEPPLRKETQPASKPVQERKKEKPAEPKPSTALPKTVNAKVEQKAVSRPQSNIAVTPKPRVAPVVDLLGMDNPAPAPVQQQPPPASENRTDEFDLFMQSAPVAAPSQSQAGSVSQNQINAFPQNSSALPSGESLMLEDKNPPPTDTKASIMSLYQSGSQQQKSVYGVPGGLYVSQQSGMNKPMMGSLGQKQPAMQMNQSGIGMNQQHMMMNRPNMGISQPNMGMPQPNIGNSRPNMGMSHPNMSMSQTHAGISQANMGISQRNMGISQPNMGISQPNMGISQPNMPMSQNQSMMSGMSQNQYMAPNMMMMQNQMQSMNMGPRNPMQAMPGSRNQFMANNFQANLGQSIMVNSYGANRPMMPAQQPILVNGPAAGLANANIGTSPTMGHTLSNQLWK